MSLVVCYRLYISCPLRILNSTILICQNLHIVFQFYVTILFYFVTEDSTSETLVINQMTGK